MDEDKTVIYAAGHCRLDQREGSSVVGRMFAPGDILPADADPAQVDQLISTGAVRRITIPRSTTRKAN